MTLCDSNHMAYSYVSMWFEPYDLLSHMAYSYVSVWFDLFTCTYVTRFTYVWVRDRTHSCVSKWHDSLCVSMWPGSFTCAYATWLIHALVCDMTHTSRSMRHDSFMFEYVIWLISVCVEGDYDGLSCACGWVRVCVCIIYTCMHRFIDGWMDGDLNKTRHLFS